MKLTVRHYTTYGRHLYAPESDTAKEFLRIIGPKKKCFTHEQIQQAKALGYEVEILPMIVQDLK